MARIKIKDLPEDQKISEQEMRQILGGISMFENFDQKTNQLISMLSTVLKSMKEMNSAVTRNLL